MGSSRTRTAGRVASARARATRAAWPPDSSLPPRPARCAAPTASSSAMARARARARGMPWQRGPKATFSSTDMWPKTPGAWASSATSRRPAGTKTPGASASRSPTVTSPPSASSRPASTAQAVDLPDPLGPMSAVAPPAGTVRSTATPRSREEKARRTWRPRGTASLTSRRPAPAWPAAVMGSGRGGLRRRTSCGQGTLVAPTTTKDRAMSTTARAREVAVSFSRSR